MRPVTRGRPVLGWAIGAVALMVALGWLVVDVVFGAQTVATWSDEHSDLQVVAVCVPYLLGANLQLRVSRGRREVARLTLEASLDTRADCEGIGGGPGVEIRGIDSGRRYLNVSFSGRDYELPLVLGGPETTRWRVQDGAK